ncbi:MAG: type II toxin-antitoxin system HicA family toxin [Lachnospiraceae bacterium]|nr:type II toxin-antitoxin system HicA family toxin [Lachnospiraceae bacterium]
MNFRKVEKILKKDGWKLVRVTGSHYQYKKVGVNELAVVPNHNGKDLSIGVLRNLEKVTGLSLRG